MVVANNTRVKGNKLGFTLDTRDFWADIVSYEMVPSDGDKDTLTFADAAGGSSSSWTLKVVGIISFDTESFWNKIWDMAGRSIPVTVAPLGNKTASPTKPHFKAKAQISSKPGISSEAGDEKGATFEVEWKLEDEPQKVTSASTMGTGNMED